MMVVLENGSGSRPSVSIARVTGIGDSAAKNVGTTPGTVAAGDHTHATGSGDVVGPASAVDGHFARFDTITGKLLKDGTIGVGDIPDISGTYSVVGHGHGLGTAATKTMGYDATNLPDIGTNFVASCTVETDANKKLITAAKATGYNLATGTASGTVATGDHGHSHTVLTDIGTTTHANIDAHIAIANPADISSFRRNGATRPRWYTMPLGCTALSVSGALTADRFYAIPFFCPKAITLDSISVNCTTLVANGHLRLGIYNDTNGEPDGRLLDAGAVSTAGTGVVSAAINQALLGGTLYWLVALSEKATHAFRAPALAGVLDVLGADATCPTTHITHFYASQAYGALPANFPAVTQGTGIVFPLIYVHASAGGK